jgi:glycosyltransferase involved in cell wall biosynthesis
MAAGLPVIATNTGGTSEIVTEENGFLFEFQDYRKLAAFIKTCLDRPEMTRKLGHSSIEKVKHHFTIDTMMKNYYKILDQVIIS